MLPNRNCDFQKIYARFSSGQRDKHLHYRHLQWPANDVDMAWIDLKCNRQTLAGWWNNNCVSFVILRLQTFDARSESRVKPRLCKKDTQQCGGKLTCRVFVHFQQFRWTSLIMTLFFRSLKVGVNYIVEFLGAQSQSGSRVKLSVSAIHIRLDEW